MSSRLHFHDDDSPAPDQTAPPSTWEETLADLEATVDRAVEVAKVDGLDDVEQLLDLDASWVPPADLGPLPAHLRERATLLLSRQLEVAEGLVKQITLSKQQRDVAARLAYAKTRPAGAFFDNRL